jgi:hypothetical protein
MTESSEICENLGFRWLVAIVTGWASLADKKSVTVATKIKPRFSHISLHFRIWWQKKERKFCSRQISSSPQKFLQGLMGAATPPFLLHGIINLFGLPKFNTKWKKMNRAKNFAAK